ncbi:cellulase family glycosylhydrolase [Actinoplanes sp. NPDC051494]|uniref:cellulase family glycosylhydrolase n=1 Tax=Actinoplanes sp. NPDC051494 TaxID=3363907 RepID=UPI003794B450
MRVRMILAGLAAAVVTVSGAVAASPAVAASTVTTIEDTAQGTGAGQVEFSAGWGACSGNCAKASDNSFTWTSTAGSTATVRFTGTQITLYGLKEPWANIATAKIDTGAAKDVDFYAATATTETVDVYTSPVLTQGTHTLVLTMTSRRNPASAGGSSITFDSAAVTAEDVPVVTADTVIEDTAVGTGTGQVTFSSGWSACSGNCGVASDNSFKWTSTAGSTATVRFTGTRITLFGQKEPWSMIATARIDSAAATDVDYYAATATTETVAVYTSPVLTQGTHTLVLTMTSRRNPASTGGASITFDSALVTGTGGTTPPPATSAHRSGLPWSDGGWFNHDPAAARGFASWRGRPVDNVVAFTDRTSWPLQLNTWWANSVPAGTDQYAFNAATDDFILSVPLWTDDGDKGTNDQWKQLARSIAAVDPNGYVRLGWEMNCCFSHARDATTWKNQYVRAVDLIREAAPGLKIVFNPNEGTSDNDTVADPRTLFVAGKADVIAIDSYDWWEPFSTDASAKDHFTKTYGWDFWYDFAQSKGLPFALGEFGVVSSNIAEHHSGGDNPRYMTYVYDWLKAKNAAKPGSIAFVSYFNDREVWMSHLYPADTNPSAAARYRQIITGLAQ